MTDFRVGDKVRAKYMSDEQIVGTVVEVDGPDGDGVVVEYSWDTIVHHKSALQLWCTVENLFIPDSVFAAEVRRSRAENSYTSCTSTSSVRVRGGNTDYDRRGATIEVWRWEAAGEKTDQRKVAQLAREAVNRRDVKLVRQKVQVFKSEHAGVASKTVYTVVAA